MEFLWIGKGEMPGDLGSIPHHSPKSLNGQIMAGLGSIPRGTKGKNSLKIGRKVKKHIIENGERSFLAARVTIPSFVGDVIPCTFCMSPVRKKSIPCQTCKPHPEFIISFGQVAGFCRAVVYCNNQSCIYFREIMNFSSSSQVIAVVAP